MKNFISNNSLLMIGLIIPIFSIILLSEHTRYKNSEVLAGNIYIELKTTLFTKLARLSYRTIIIFLVIYLFPQIRGMNSQSNLLDPIYLIISVIFAIVASLLYYRPQKICENGILDSYGLISWDNIKKIKDNVSQSDRLILILKSPVRNSNHITLYCTTEEINTVRSFIENHIIAV